FKSSTMSEGTLFRIQGVVAIVVGLVVLIWPSVLTWLLSLLVAGSAVVAVTPYPYVDVGALGPLPALYEHTWRPPGKVLPAVAELVAAVLSLIGLVSALSRRRRRAAAY